MPAIRTLRVGTSAPPISVTSANRDVHPRSRRAPPFIAASTVSLGADDVMRFKRASYQPYAGSAELIGYMADSAGDFLKLSVANLSRRLPTLKATPTPVGALSAPDKRRNWEKGERLDNDPSGARYGCFLPDLTGLARHSPAPTSHPSYRSAIRDSQDGRTGLTECEQ